MLPPYGVARPKEGDRLQGPAHYIIHHTSYADADAEARAAPRFYSIGGLLWTFDGVLLTN